MRHSGSGCEGLNTEDFAVDQAEEVHWEECEDNSLHLVRSFFLTTPYLKVVVINLNVESDRKGNWEKCVAYQNEYIHRNEQSLTLGYRLEELKQNRQLEHKRCEYDHDLEEQGLLSRQDPAEYANDVQATKHN